jgi:hypothetical protein
LVPRGIIADERISTRKRPFPLGETISKQTVRKTSIYDSSLCGVVAIWLRSEPT